VKYHRFTSQDDVNAKLFTVLRRFRSRGTDDKARDHDAGEGRYETDQGTRQPDSRTYSKL